MKGRFVLRLVECCRRTIGLTFTPLTVSSTVHFPLSSVEALIVYAIKRVLRNAVQKTTKIFSTACRSLEFIYGVQSVSRVAQSV
jgi:hypothetical protein